MLDIVELQRKLTDNRNLQIQQQHEQQQVSDRLYRLRAAALEKEREKQKQERQRDVVGLLDEDYNADQVSYILDIPVSEVARIAEYNQGRWKFLTTGILELPKSAAGLTIFKR